MIVQGISYKNTGYFSKIVTDYLKQTAELNNFYGNFPDLEGFKKQLELKQLSFKSENRKTLVKVLDSQYKKLNISELTQGNIKLLGEDNTFTITTGHQLNIFTGPLYFLYKIVSAINLAKQLKEAYPNYNFVPVYWMATEDHDFEEINYFNFKENKVKWDRESSGAVGRLKTTNFYKVYQEFSELLGTSKNEEYLKELFKKAYLNHTNLAAATRFLVNELFGKYGLVIIDGDNNVLKKQFIPIIEDELLHQTSFKEVTKTNEQLKKYSYKIQVNPREINLFYLKYSIRERIVFEENSYKINQTDLVFTKDEILEELYNYPERFSPNVLMRGLYQETILPNLCYIGGGGELAYWFQLKNYFEKVNVTFPILLLRNSALFISSKQMQKLQKLGISISNLFKKQDVLVSQKIKEISKVEIDFSTQKEFLEQQFELLKEVAKQTDYSFLGAVNAQEKKQLKGLNNLEKRLLKAEKRKYADIVDRIKLIQNELFPNQSLEERTRNFSEIYILVGNDLIPKLIEHLKPLDLQFTVLEY
ncbi:MAG: bacillithiol biosynthesis cysteine-adding enzyme BshC [Lutibacter sp.]|uniref:bacillithiol biosynthesis cysteine-adding enzyme BshC n=1 Tax=Lutibacter sp. TaxID=1925666 RepID=UPI00299CF042|nr:bacillithiol biosynthesis cysteine-adding enzyme BshC [Lutibacter sp.]MDX1828381.1 bacillithiol biosynthesis cysteine-adding enzyme BshC [Lutibacter sp.]